MLNGEIELINRMADEKLNTLKNATDSQITS